MKTNVKKCEKTHGGCRASHIKKIQELERSVLSCMLWENGFYENGEQVSDRIKELVHQCEPFDVAELAVKARFYFKLRHAPLLLVRELARNKRCVGNLVSKTLEKIIMRADELTEFLSIYWLDGKQPLSSQVKKGLALAFGKFNEYQLAKYNRDGSVKLRDVLFLCHAKPSDKNQEELWKRLISGHLKTPDTWEVALCSGADKKETFERLIRENKLGYMAILRNLRNMYESKVDKSLVYLALMDGAKKSKALPFRYISAARAVPSWEEEIEDAMLFSLQDRQKVTGKTVLLVDTSGSMGKKISEKSDLNRLDAAKALAILARETFSDVSIFSFNEKAKLIPSRRGMALADAIGDADGCTYLGKAIAQVVNNDVDRLIIFTDEQSNDNINTTIIPKKTDCYIINVSNNKNGIAYNRFVHINGMSESVIDFIVEYEKSNCRQM